MLLDHFMCLIVKTFKSFVLLDKVFIITTLVALRQSQFSIGFSLFVFRTSQFPVIAFVSMSLLLGNTPKIFLPLILLGLPGVKSGGDLPSDINKHFVPIHEASFNAIAWFPNMVFCLQVLTSLSFPGARLGIHTYACAYS